MALLSGCPPPPSTAVWGHFRIGSPLRAQWFWPLHFRAGPGACHRGARARPVSTCGCLSEGSLVLPRSHPVAGSEQLPAASVGPAGDLRPFLRPFLRRSPGALGRGQLHRTDICVLGSTGAAVTGQQLPLPPVPEVPRPSWRPPSGYRAGCPWTEILSGGRPSSALREGLGAGMTHCLLRPWGSGGSVGRRHVSTPACAPREEPGAGAGHPHPGHRGPGQERQQAQVRPRAACPALPGRPPRGTRLFPFAFLC